MTRLKVLSQFGILCWGSLSLVYSLRLLISFDGQTGLSIRGSLQPCWMKWVQMGSGIRWMSHRKSFYKHANVPVNSYILTEIFFLSDVALLTDNPSHLKQLQGNITEYATARGETLLFSGLRAQKLHVPEFPWGWGSFYPYPSLLQGCPRSWLPLCSCEWTTPPELQLKLSDDFIIKTTTGILLSPPPLSG